jgi:hypothetical protein
MTVIGYGERKDDRGTGQVIAKAMTMQRSLLPKPLLAFDSCSMGSISHAKAWMLPQQLRMQNAELSAAAGEISPRRILRILWSK